MTPMNMPLHPNDRPLSDRLKKKISEILDEYTMDNSKVSKEKLYQMLAEIYDEWDEKSKK